MTWNDMLNDFTVILNRDDCSAAQAKTFLMQGVQRIQRDCRLPSMERQQIIVCNGPTNFIMAPSDLIQPIDIIWTPGSSQAPFPVALEKVPYRKLLPLLGSGVLRLPTKYARSQTQFWIGGPAVEGDTIQFLYYGNFSAWPTPDSENELSASTPDLAVYAALSYAGDYFECSLTGQWEQRFQSIKAETIQMAQDLDAEGGPQVIEPSYHWD
jgi:hypothetical protein